MCFTLCGQLAASFSKDEEEELSDKDAHLQIRNAHPHPGRWCSVHTALYQNLQTKLYYTAAVQFDKNT